MRYFLCGQTGNINRGCEAIIRSTVKVLNQSSGDVYVATYAPKMDSPMARELGITIIPYASYPSSIHRYASVAMRRINKKSVAGLRYILKPVTDEITSGDTCFTIGGDTYCYGRPVSQIAFNKYTHKNKIDNILWCCSVEKNNITKEIKEDLNRYKYIFAREIITYNTLIQAGIDSEKIIKCCDPAFFLDCQQVPLPDGFAVGNTVGVNLSEMVISDSNPTVWDNVCAMIDYILNKTDMSICLVPHVYSIERNSNDYPILKKIKEKYNNPRICMVDDEYNCEQLKYIISKCRFFVGARTHSTIAAYSSEIPTLVLGYSVKSKGIATDLFGTYDGYVLPYDELRETSALADAFANIVANESNIKDRLSAFLPEYKKQLSDALSVIKKKYVSDKFDICDPFRCTGCSACEQNCPQKCIQIKQNEQGFAYPKIDYDKCIGCRICQKKCPVKNKYKDDNQTPQTYACINKDQDVKMSSSSGGVFSALAHWVINQGGVVYGAAFDDNFKLKHQRAESIDGLDKFRSSKYLQSDTSGVFNKVKEDLEAGKQVLFSGTPCQIGGLYSVLDKKYDNLLTVDLVCHGVPSPMVWDKYLKFREQEAASVSDKVSFRDKKTGWKKYSLTIGFKNGDEYSKPLTEDLYMRGFLSHIFIRNSCTSCSFKNVHRQADITLADFWGVEKLYPDLNDDKGVSLVMIHSPKGSDAFLQVKDTLVTQTVDFESAISQNSSMTASVKINPLSKRFYKDLTKMPVDRVIEKYCSVKLTSKLRRKMAQILR